MTYLVLLLPVLVLPGLLAFAAFERRCSDRTPFVPATLLRRNRRPEIAAELTGGAAPAEATAS